MGGNLFLDTRRRECSKHFLTRDVILGLDPKIHHCAGPWILGSSPRMTEVRALYGQNARVLTHSF